jgi:hypothetical protein
MTLNAKVKLGSLLVAAAIGAMTLILSVSSAEALKNCTGPTHQCGVPPGHKCHTIPGTCPAGVYHCRPHTVTVCN